MAIRAVSILLYYTRAAYVLYSYIRGIHVHAGPGRKVVKWSGRNAKCGRVVDAHIIIDYGSPSGVRCVEERGVKSSARLMNERMAERRTSNERGVCMGKGGQLLLYSAAAAAALCPDRPDRRRGGWAPPRTLANYNYKGGQSRVVGPTGRPGRRRRSL